MRSINGTAVYIPSTDTFKLLCGIELAGAIEDAVSLTVEVQDFEENVVYATGTLTIEERADNAWKVTKTGATALQTPDAYVAICTFTIGVTPYIRRFYISTMR